MRPKLVSHCRSVAWDQQYLPKEHTLFALGVSLLGPYIIDICNVPHLLLGGETGSGKSQLLKLLLAQAIMRGDYDITIIDYKAVWTMAAAGVRAANVF